MNNTSLDIELENVDISKLDAFEQYHLSNLLMHSTKADALKIIINNTEGDFSQLSPELERIASKYYETGGNVGFESSSDALEYAYKIKDYYFGHTDQKKYLMSLTEQEIMDYLLDSGYNGKDRGRFFDMVISSLVDLGVNLEMKYKIGGQISSSYIGSCIDVDYGKKEVCNYFPDATVLAEFVGNPDEDEWGKSKKITPQEFYKYVSKDEVPKKSIKGNHTYHYIAEDNFGEQISIDESAIFFIYNEDSDIHYFFKIKKYSNGGDISQIMAMSEMSGMGMPKPEKKSDLQLKLEYKEKERLTKEKEKKAKERSKKINKFKGSVKKGVSNVFKKIKKHWDSGGLMDMTYNDDYTGMYMATETMVRNQLVNGEISESSLREILGKNPDYPNQVVGSLLLKKCFLKPFYKI